jgi:kynureninase
MTRDEGHALLNQIREGQTFEYEQITAALIATGDLAGWRETHLVGSLAAGMRSQGLDQAIQTSRQRTGQTPSGCMVGADEGKNSESPWPGWSKYIDCRHEQDQK